MGQNPADLGGASHVSWILRDVGPPFLQSPQSQKNGVGLGAPQKFPVCAGRETVRLKPASEAEPNAALKSVRENSGVPPGRESILPLYPALNAPGYYQAPLRGANRMTVLHRANNGFVLTHALMGRYFTVVRTFLNFSATSLTVGAKSRLTFALSIFLMSVALGVASSASAKPHLITFGKWMMVQWMPGNNAEPLSIKVRPLIIDGRTKEFVTGAPHEITERMFAVRRVFRINDSLPDEAGTKWQWQRGGWLLVDRFSGRISTLNLPDFDVVYSSSSWFRDYVAYCGVSDDRKETYAIVAQLNRRKPVLKKPVAEGIIDDAVPDSACHAPVWQRAPVRVSFEARGSDKQTFAVRGHVVDAVDDDDQE